VPVPGPEGWSAEVDRLTAVLIVRDEAGRLPGCLASLRGAVDQVVVLDTGSSDGTRDLLAALAADPGTEPPLRWSERPFDDFSRSRSAALARVRTPFFLWIDADERLSPELASELARRRREGSLAAHDLWLLRRENRVLGRRMRARSLTGQWVGRLGRTGAVRLSGAPVHEGLVAHDRSGSPGRLDGVLIHEALDRVGPYLRKIDHYTSLEVQAGRSRHGRWQPLHLLATGPATFAREYLHRGCWRDGRAGLVWAALAAWSATLRSWKVLRGR
jgi:(heptosyl)LPS beta-1,4-glucosyltransferase